MKKASSGEKKFNPFLVNIMKLKKNFKGSRPENGNSDSYNPFSITQTNQVEDVLKYFSD